MIPESWATFADQAADLAEQYGQHIAVGAGAVGALIAIYAIRRFVKTQEHDDLAANLGVLLFAVVTTEGMWEVVHHKLGVNVPLTVAMFTAFDVVIYSQGRLAIRKLKANPKARVGTYLAIIWALSIAASITVSTAGGNTTTQLFRFFSPLVAAALWTQKVLELRSGTAERAESNWIWTPTRLMIRWGWLKPGAADDLTETFRLRRITALVDAGLELHVQRQASTQDRPSRWLRRRDPLTVARRRMQRLTKTADRADVVAARKQLRLTLNIERELFRDDEPTDEDRQALDDIRLITRRAADRVRVDHVRAFGPDQMRTVGGVRMPDHIADQIPDQVPDGWLDRYRSGGVDQTLDRSMVQSADRSMVQPVDQPAVQVPGQPADQPDQPAVDRQPHPGPAEVDQPADQVDQPATSAIPAAATTSRPKQTTVRLDRSKPVSPAAGGEIPPRVQAMVRDLRRKYRGEIPGRRTVMPVMGWTNAQDAQTAINMVRAERTKTTSQ